MGPLGLIISSPLQITDLPWLVGSLDYNDMTDHVNSHYPERPGSAQGNDFRVLILELK